MQRKLNDSFIDQYCSRFSEKISTDFFTEKSTITGKEILSVSPSRQINFFILKTLFNSWQEEMKKLESPYFNFKDADVRKAMIAFMNTLSQKIEIDRNNFQPLLESATREMLVFLADPNTFLVNEFSQTSTAFISEKAAKTFLKYQKVFKEEFESFLGEHLDGPSAVMFDQAKLVFDSAEWQQTAAFELSILDEFESISFEELYESEPVEQDESVFALDDEDSDFEAEVNEEEIVIDEPEPQESDFISEDDEDLSDEEPADEDDVEGEADDLIAEDELEEEIIEEEPEVTEESDDEFISEEAEDEEIDDFSEEENVVDSNEDAHEVEDSEDEFVAEEETEDDELEEEPEEEDESVPLNEKLSEGPSRIVNEQFEEPQVTIADQMQQAKVTSIMDAISINNRYMFTNELFDGDKEQFEEAVQIMENCQSFDDAVEILVQDYAKLRDWDMNSDEVKELLKVVFRKFR